MPKIITRENIVEEIEKHKTLWAVPDPLIWKYDPKKRKMYLLTCQCGVKRWIHWRKLRVGASGGCKSCRRKVHGLRYHPLYLSWHRLREQMVPQWAEFKGFEAWASKLFEPGWKLIRLNRNLPYGPDNCDYTPINRKKIAAIKQATQTPADILPTNERQRRWA